VKSCKRTKGTKGQKRNKFEAQTKILHKLLVFLSNDRTNTVCDCECRMQSCMYDV